MANNAYNALYGQNRQPQAAGPEPALPEYGPTTTGCPAVEQAIEGLYRAQDQQSFWALIHSLNYAIQMRTEVLAPVQLSDGQMPGAPAPWAHNPIPAENSQQMQPWLLQNGKRKWYPVFTNTQEAMSSRATALRPVMRRTLEQMVRLAVGAQQAEGLVINPWGCSATLERGLLQALLRAVEAPPGEPEPEQQQCAQQIWQWIREGDRLAAQGGAPGQALLAYRKAEALARTQPDISYRPELCLRLARHEVQYTSRPEAEKLAAEALHGFALRVAAGEDSEAAQGLADTKAFCRALAAPPAARPNLWGLATEALQKQ